MSQRAAYGPVTRLLHWLTVLAMGLQFLVGYGLGEDPEDSLEDIVEDGGLILVHVVLGAGILVLALARVAWRRHAGLPPWAEQLSPALRTVAHWTERVLLAMQFAAPLSGLVLVLVTDDALGMHIATHVLFLAALAVHLGYVLAKGLLPRMLV